MSRQGRLRALLRPSRSDPERARRSHWLRLGRDEKSGAWFSFDSQRLGQGRENSKAFLKANPEVSDRIELIEGDARETITDLSGPFDLLFVDAAKGQYREYIELAEPLLSERALLVIDNLLVGGEVALPEGAESRRSPEAIESARALNSELLVSERWLGSVLPIGDGVGIAARL